MNVFTKKNYAQCACFVRGSATHPRFLHIFTARVQREGNGIEGGGGGWEGWSEQGGQSGRKELHIGLIGNNHAVSGLGKSCSSRPIGKSWLVGLVMTKSSCLVWAIVMRFKVWLNHGVSCLASQAVSCLVTSMHHEVSDLCKAFACLSYLNKSCSFMHLLVLIQFKYG